MTLGKHMETLRPTLMARNYKGFENKSMNGVIEWK